MSCHRQGYQLLDEELDQASQGLIQPGLEHLQGQGSHSFSGQLCQRLTILSVKNFPLTSDLNPSSFSLKPFHSCPEIQFEKCQISCPRLHPQLFTAQHMDTTGNPGTAVRTWLAVTPQGSSEQLLRVPAALLQSNSSYKTITVRCKPSLLLNLTSEIHF